MSKKGTNSQVFHAFAHSTGEYHSNASGSVYIQAGIIYSYGNHYPMAQYIGGSRMCLVNEDNYGATTSKQRSQLVNTIPSALICYVPCVVPQSDSDHIQNIEYLHDKIENMINTHMRARIRSYTQMIHRLHDCLTSYCEIVELHRESPLNGDTEQMISAKDAGNYEVIDAFNKKWKEATAKAEAEKLALDADKIKAWRNCTGAYHTGTQWALLRVNGGMVETSNGMSVDCQQVALMLKVWKNEPKKLIGQAFRGIHGERFQLSLCSGGVKAGCHTFKNKELGLLFEALTGKAVA